MTKRMCALGMLTVLVTVAACDRTEVAPASKPPVGKARTFDSELAFDVYVHKTPDTPAKRIGRTPSAEPLKIPAGASWYIVPVGRRDMAKVLATMRSAGVPGLGLEDVTDADLAHVKEFRELRVLSIGYSEQLTDAGLEHLKELGELRTLSLVRCRQITDAGLAHLKGLTELRILVLGECGGITDVGLAHLKGLRELRRLDLIHCGQITREAAADLKKALPNTEIKFLVQWRGFDSGHWAR